MSAPPLPRFFGLRQSFSRSAPINLEAALGPAIESLAKGLRPGARVAVGVGSRGIANLATIVTHVVSALQKAGAAPFIVPAMGSHGGATPDGQLRILADYGVTEHSAGAPIRAAMETRAVGRNSLGMEVMMGTEALDADAILPINRIKPHTDFQGGLGSGIVKMLVVGCGKHAGASGFHRSAMRLGYEEALREAAAIILQHTPVLGGVALVEDAHHQTAAVEIVQPDDFIAAEERLQSTARNLMPGLPFDDLDLLIVDRIGKNISGTGMDTNVIGRGVHGYSTHFGEQAKAGFPCIKRILVRDLTPETHGNAIGIGMADFTTDRLLEKTDRPATNVNSLTATTLHAAKLPISFPTDREAITKALGSLGLPADSPARVLRIRDTLSLESMRASEALLQATLDREDLQACSEPEAPEFDDAGQLRDLPAS